MKNSFFLALIVMSIFIRQEVTAKTKGDLDFEKAIQPITKDMIFENDSIFTWGASPIKGQDGLYHLFYSRWHKKYGFMAWVTHSEIAHAVSKSPYGPYVFSDVALAARDSAYWDGLTTHNPTIRYYNNKYYLYYMGTTGNRKITHPHLNYDHRNKQRIGVAVSDSPYGPWKRSERPLIDVSSDPLAADALACNNPSITLMPDGRYLMVYKAVAKKRPLPFGGPVVHLCAVADSPEGPFYKYSQPVFTIKGSDFPAEDPYIWCQDSCFYAIVKDMNGEFTRKGRSLALFYSRDGFDWKPANRVLVSNLSVKREDGTLLKLTHLERPQLLFENGIPIALYLAADITLEHSFNIHIPLKWEEDK